jgi:hypothetical protein
MGQIVDYCSEFCSGKAGDTWNWFNGLNREEWMVVLAIVAAAGFACMFGMHARK